MMKILMTGQHGYLGTVMAPVMKAAGHQVFGLDTCYFCDHPTLTDPTVIGVVRKDIRSIVPEDLEGLDAVVHLAALSNDPLGELNPELTHGINHCATLSLARLAKEAGIPRFLYSSTCSVYGVAGPDDIATETSPLHPLTAYAVSKLRAEEDLAGLADESFSPVFLRNATAYGWSPRFRLDLVLNNLSGWAYTTGEIRILSDGTPWRPIVHVQDIARAFAAVLEAPREATHNQAFNVGVNGENYQVRDLAAIVQEAFPECRIHYAGQGGPDPRSYRVDFSRLAHSLPNFKPGWSARLGVQELCAAFDRIGLTQQDFTGSKYTRLARLKELIGAGLLDSQLYWKERAILG